MQETSLLKKKNVSTTNNVITSSCLSSASSDVTTPGGDDNGDEDVDMNNNNSNSNNRVVEKKRTSTGFSFWYKLPKKAYRVYTGYAKQLWKDTDTSARSRIANDKVAQTIRDMQHVLNNEYYYAATNTTTTTTTSGDSESEGNGDTDNKGLVPNATEDEQITNEKAKEQLLEACNTMLTVLDDQEDKSKAVVLTTPEAEAGKASSKVAKNKTKKKPRSVLFGALMGLTVAGWVFSGDYIFTGLFCLITILGQLEYYRMIMNTGVFPARRISVVGATSMFVTALFAPDLHQLCLPMFGLWAMIWKLTMRRKIATIPEIAATFTGMFYLGYVPSFWIRIRTIGQSELMEPTRLFPIMAAMRKFLQQKFGFLVPTVLISSPITSGAVFIFWSWISLAFSDVGAYFVGRKFGKTKLGQISPAAGATSPNKSVEGVIGGCIASSLFSIAGAWAQKWPHFILTGLVHGTLLALLGLIGDLTASMLKRDAGLKDFGNLIPEHGGIMDRVDSFIWTAPYSFLVINFVLPAIMK